jgi:hypothetical protein
VRYVYAQVWNRETKLPPKKVFYFPNKGEKKRLPFEADVALWPGSNLIQVFARNGNKIQSVGGLTVLGRAERNGDSSCPDSYHHRAWGEKRTQWPRP